MPLAFRRGFVIVLGLAMGVLFFAVNETRLPARQVARGARLAPVTSLSVFFVGHSLVGHEMPKMLRALARSRGIDLDVGTQIIDGSPLEVQWEHPERSTSGHARTELASGRWDTVVLAEAVNLDDMLRYHAPSTYAARFFALARSARPDARVFLLEAWHDRHKRRRLVEWPSQRVWRASIDRDRPKWERIVDEASRGAASPMGLVPAGTALGRLVDAIEDDRVPGVTVDDVFHDGIHMRPLGNYYMALVQLATLTRRSPEGATTTPRDETGRVLVRVPDATARAFAALAWRVVETDPRAHVRRPR